MKWYRENRDRAIALSTAWRKNNRDRYLTGRRTSYQLNKEKLQERGRKYYQEVRKILRKDNPVTREYERLAALKRIAKLRWFIQNLKVELGGKCAKCGYGDQPRILQFHHLNGMKDKLGNISEMKSMSKIRAEAAKCILLCPNCHALEHLT